MLSHCAVPAKPAAALHLFLHSPVIALRCTCKACCCTTPVHRVRASATMKAGKRKRRTLDLGLEVMRTKRSAPLLGKSARPMPSRQCVPESGEVQEARPSPKNGCKVNAKPTVKEPAGGSPFWLSPVKSGPESEEDLGTCPPSKENSKAKAKLAGKEPAGGSHLCIPLGH
eukprot:1162054-Pelagomonas_calceolata.AAC.9